MPVVDPQPVADTLAAFVSLCGEPIWAARLQDLQQRSRSRSLSGRVAQQRHGLELSLQRLTCPDARARASKSDRLLFAFAQEAVELAATLPAASRTRLRETLCQGLRDKATLIPLFHLLRSAGIFRRGGFGVSFSGLREGTPHDLLIERDGVAAEVVCTTISAEEGRPVHRGDWCALVDAISPDLQTWLAAHPGRYLLKMTLPGGLAGADQAAELQRRITTLLQERRRGDTAADVVLKLDPLLLAGAQAQDRQHAGLPAQLRAQFGPEAHLAVTTDSGSGSVFVMAARAGQENAIAAAVCQQLAVAATRLSGSRPGILAAFLDDIDRTEWLGLRERLELEGAVRRFLTTPPARDVVAVSCASRFELFGAPAPDSAPGGELRFRNPSHPAAKLAALAPAVLSSV